jgi:hypothetical protein
MKNTNQQYRNDHHKVTKLAKEEWDQTDTRLTKYDKNSERTSCWNYQPDIVHWEVSRNANCQSDIVWVKSDIVRWDRTLYVGRSLKTRFSPKILLFLPKFDSWAIGHQIGWNFNTMATSTQGTSYQKWFFSNPKIFLLIFGWTKKLKFLGVRRNPWNRRG